MWKCTFQLHRLGHKGGDTHKRFLALCGAINQDPLPPADRTESKNLPIKSIIRATRLFSGCKSRQERRRQRSVVVNFSSVWWRWQFAENSHVSLATLCVCRCVQHIFPCSFQTVFLYCGLSQMYSPSYMDPCIKRIKRLTFFGGEAGWVWGGKHQSSILSQIANKTQEGKGSVRENTLDQEKAERIQCLEIGRCDTGTFLKWWCFATSFKEMEGRASQQIPAYLYVPTLVLWLF